MSARPKGSHLKAIYPGRAETNTAIYAVTVRCLLAAQTRSLPAPDLRKSGAGATSATVAQVQTSAEALKASDHRGQGKPC